MTLGIMVHIPDKLKKQAIKFILKIPYRNLTSIFLMLPPKQNTPLIMTDLVIGRLLRHLIRIASQWDNH